MFDAVRRTFEISVRFTKKKMKNKNLDLIRVFGVFFSVACTTSKRPQEASRRRTQRNVSELSFDDFVVCKSKGSDEMRWS
jgi:hypothetical protein